MIRSRRTGYIMALAAAIVWAATSPGIKYLLDTYDTPELTVAFWRDAFIAVTLGSALLTLRLLRGAGRAPELIVGRRDLGILAITGVISIGMYHGMWIYSIALNGAALAVVLIYTYPAFVTLGAWLLFHEPITRQQLAALALSFVGSVLLVRAYDPEVLRVSWLGVLVGLGTGLTHAVYVLSSQRAVTRNSPWVTLMYTMLAGSVTLLLLTLVAQGPETLMAVGPGAAPWLILVALAIGPTLGGYALFTLSLRHIPGRIASLLVLIEAPIASGLSVLLLGEKLIWQQLLGIVFVLSAAVLPTLAERRSEPSTSASEPDSLPA